jgi:hypothetical protein
MIAMNCRRFFNRSVIKFRLFICHLLSIKVSRESWTREQGTRVHHPGAHVAIAIFGLPAVLRRLGDAKMSVAPHRHSMTDRPKPMQS